MLDVFETSSGQVVNHDNLMTSIQKSFHQTAHLSRSGSHVLSGNGNRITNPVFLALPYRSLNLVVRYLAPACPLHLDELIP